MDLDPRRRRRWNVRLLTAALAVLLLAPAAFAGGDFVDATAGSRSVWVVGDFGVREFDAVDGHVLYAPRPTTPSTPISVVVADGAAWIASIENGFVDGRITRIELRTHRTRVVWHAARGSALYVAAGAGGVYALLGSATGNRVILLAPDGRVTGSWAVGSGGRMAADASGCWVSSERGLLHIDRAGRLRLALRAPFGDVATGEDAVWLAPAGAVTRLDEHTGRVTTLATERLRLGGFQHDLAVGDRALWTIELRDGAGWSTLDRRDPRTGAVQRRVRIRGLAEAIAVTPAAVWVATADRVARYDPATLQLTLSAALI